MHTAQRLGYTVVTWDVMTNDWATNKCAKDIVHDIVSRVRPGSIIVMHDGRNGRDGFDRSQTLQALPQIIEVLQEQGFDFVSVPEIIQLEVNPLSPEN